MSGTQEDVNLFLYIWEINVLSMIGAEELKK